MSISHVALEVRREDVAAEVGFWALIEFEAVSPPDSLAERSAWVARGATQVHLLFADAPVIPAEGHVALVLGDAFGAACERLRAAGHAPEPRAEHWGAARAFVRTPAGHRVELMAAGPS